MITTTIDAVLYLIPRRGRGAPRRARPLGERLARAPHLHDNHISYKTICIITQYSKLV